MKIEYAQRRPFQSVSAAAGFPQLRDCSTWRMALGSAPTFVHDGKVFCRRCVEGMTARVGTGEDTGGMAMLWWVCDSCGYCSEPTPLPHSLCPAARI